MENDQLDSTIAAVSAKGDSVASKHLECGGDKEAAGDVHFFPPLYIQRYSFAATVLMEHAITSVIDFGCSECGCMQLLPTVPSLERIALVDIDRDLLELKKQNIKPELRHHIFRRQKPLHVSLLAGSAQDTDLRLVDYEAVTMIELVEHLYPDVLEKVVLNVFGVLTPKLCLITTPNSEFNVLFDNENPKQFRHWDHKFEWTMEEFGQWCNNICKTYGYSVQYAGVGRLPSRQDIDHLGPCTQAAVFRLQGVGASQRSGQQGSQCYDLIAESDFPYEKDVLSLAEKIDLEVSYCLRQLVALQGEEASPGQPVLVAVSRLAGLHTVRKLCVQSDVRESLQRSGHRLSPDGLFVILDDDDDEADSDSLDNLGEEDCVEGSLDGNDVDDCVSVQLQVLQVGVLGGGDIASLLAGRECPGGCLPYCRDFVADENWDTECS